MTSSRGIRAVIFDVGGVLDLPGDLAAEEADRLQLASRIGMEIEEMWGYLYRSEAWKLARTGQITDAAFWDRCLSPLGITEPADQAAFAQRLNLFKEVVSAMRTLLDELYGRTRLAIISNASDTLEETLEERYQITHYFQIIINSARVGYAKPEREIYEIALDRLDLRPEETIFIDDQQHNVDAAAELGIQATRFTSLPDLRAYLRDFGLLES